MEDSSLTNEAVCVPGVPCENSITVKLLDSFGNTLTLDNSSIATMSSNDSQYSISGFTKSIAQNGVFLFQDYAISGSPGTNAYISISTSIIDPSLQLKANDNVTYNSYLNFTIFIRNCTLGEQYRATSCIECPQGTYIFEPGLICNNCPVGGNCPGG